MYMCDAQNDFDLLHDVCKRVRRLVIYVLHSSSYSDNHTLHCEDTQHVLHPLALNVIKCPIHVIFVNTLVILKIQKKKKIQRESDWKCKKNSDEMSRASDETHQLLNKASEFT